MTIVSEFRRKYHEKRYFVAKNLLPKEGTLLDIGCGRPCETMPHGSFLKYLGYGSGVDVFPIKGDNFYQCNVHKLPFKDNSFDVITALDVLEHIDNLDLALKEIKRVLKRNGIFIFSTPTNNLLWNSIWYVWERTVGSYWKHDHLIELPKKTWIKILSKHFSIQKVQNFYGLIFFVRMKNV